MAVLSATPVLIARSALFQATFYLWTAVFCLTVLPAYPFLSPAGMRAVARRWQRSLLWLLRVTVGLGYEVRGSERIPAGPVYRLPEVLDDPQVRARELLRPMPFPGVAADLPIADTPVRLSQSAGAIRRRAPAVGEHTDEILGELGYSAAEIADLRRLDIV